MVYVCGCGQVATNSYHLAVIKKVVCPVCASNLSLFSELPMSFWVKHQSFIDLSEDFLSVKRKQILDAIKINQPCSDRDLAVYLGWDRCMVTGRRFELANCSIPFIVPMGDKIDDTTKKRVTLWTINKYLDDVERIVERKVMV